MRWVVAFALLAGPAAAQDVTAASFRGETTRYPHGVLGDAVEWESLVMETAGGETFGVTLPDSRVFEDTQPRLADVDGDGDREVVVVETALDAGARLSVYDPQGLVAATDFIGTPNRWLAPVGVADFDGDGAPELAYVDRPHRDRVLRLLRLEDGALTEVATYDGVTNHRAGEPEISGGVRDCDGRPEMIVADPDWSEVLAVAFEDGALTSRSLGPLADAQSFAAALDCESLT